MVGDGAQPSHPISLGFDILSSPGEYKDILWFWGFKCSERFEFRTQLAEWKKFRDFQTKVREFYVKRHRFHEWVQLVRESQQHMKYDWHISVHPDAQRQNPLETWNEYRAYQYRYLKACNTTVECTELKLISELKELKDAESRTHDAIVDRDVLYHRVEEVVSSKKKICDARSRVESTQQTLQVAKVDKDFNASKRAALVSVAEEELSAARKNLNDVSETEEMRRLREGYELVGYRQGVADAEGRLRSAKSYVDWWEVLLNWIDNQYPAIASACGYIASGDRRNISPSHRELSEEKSYGGKSLRPAVRQRRQSDLKSVLRPNSSSKISKASKGNSSRHHRERLLSSDNLPTLQISLPSSPRRSERGQTSKTNPAAKSPERSCLRQVQPTRVTKTARQKPVQRDQTVLRRSRRIMAQRLNNSNSLS